MYAAANDIIPILGHWQQVSPSHVLLFVLTSVTIMIPPNWARVGDPNNELSNLRLAVARLDLNGVTSSPCLSHHSIKLNLSFQILSPVQLVTFINLTLLIIKLHVGQWYSSRG